ncbi:hypothetical protein D9757_013009, partial [Collybiopsis confluens]
MASKYTYGDKFCSGRVYIMGDAAHCYSPAVAKFNLAWKLALVHRGLSKAEILTTYEIERMPVVAEMLNLSTELHKHTIGAHEKFRAGISPSSEASKDPMFRGRNLSQLWVNYRWSPIVFDDQAGITVEHTNPSGLEGDRLRAGDRA